MIQSVALDGTTKGKTVGIFFAHKGKLLLEAKAVVHSSLWEWTHINDEIVE